MKQIIKKLYKWLVASRNVWIWGIYEWRQGSIFVEEHLDYRFINNIEELYRFFDLGEYTVRETLSLRYPDKH